MKRIWLITGLAVAGAALFALGYFSESLTSLLQRNRVLAKVDHQPITELDLKREIVFLRVSKTVPLSDITREDILDRLINDVLILNEGQRLQIQLPDNAVSAYLENFWKGYSEDAVRRILAENGLTSQDWEELIRRRLTIEQIIKQAVEDRVHAGQDEVEEYYWTHLMEFYRQDQVHARQIVVDTLEQAEALRQKLEGGAAFAALAKDFSRGPEKDQGGDLGWVGAGDMPRAFSQVLFKLRKDEISKPVATEYGYHLFLVEDRRTGGKISLDEARPRIASDLKLAKIDRAFQTWLEELRSRATITMHDRRGVE